MECKSELESSVIQKKATQNDTLWILFAVDDTLWIWTQCCDNCTKISIHLCKWDNVAFKDATIREPDSFLVAINESFKLKSRYMGF